MSLMLVAGGATIARCDSFRWRRCRVASRTKARGSDPSHSRTQAAYQSRHTFVDGSSIQNHTLMDDDSLTEPMLGDGREGRPVIKGNKAARGWGFTDHASR